MKIVVGHKNLNLEELFNVAYLPSQNEVVVDNVISCEFNPQPPQVQNKELQQSPELLPGLVLNQDHVRAILLVKLVQLIKLKKNVTKQTINYFVTILNENRDFLKEEGKTFWQALFEHARYQNIFFSEKELFILQAQPHIYQALFALEVYKLQQGVRLIDTSLAYSLETLNVHQDYLTEYALTLGKSSQGVNNFKNNILSLIDKSKLIGTAAQPDKALNLSKVFQLHGTLNERLIQLGHSLTNEINSDYGALFSEKKYKELIQIAKDQQPEQLIILSQQVSPLAYLTEQLVNLSTVREQLLKGQRQQDTEMKEHLQEESKSSLSQDCPVDLQRTFDIVSRQTLLNAYQQELWTAFNKNRSIEAEMIAKAKLQAAQQEAKQQEEAKDGAAGATDDKKKQQQQRGGGAKKKGKEAVTTIQFGVGTRKFFDYLLSIELNTPEIFEHKMNVLINKELDSVLDEVLEQRNEERRKPKCPKGTRDMLPIQMAIRERAFNIIKSVFKRHGACEIDTPVFELKETLMGKYGEESKLIYDLEDQGGELLSLRYDLTVPFARYVTLNNFEKIKRFHIAKVYRRDNPQMSKGRFREFYQCDFDIAGQYSLMIPDSEVLKVLTEILEQLDIGEFVIKLNHRKFLDAMVDLAGCEHRKFKAICSSVDKLDKEPWEKVREELIMMKGLTSEMCDKLEKFVKLVGKPFELLQKLKDEGIFAGHKEGEETIKEMETLFEYLQAMNCLDRISFDFSLARGLDYYTGLIYEAVLTDPSNRVGSIAGGGRYDGLVGMFSGKTIPAVGVSIGIERVFAILEEKLKKDTSVRSTETQIYVAQIGKNLVAERLKICSELWSIGIKAETSYQDNPNTQRQMEFTLLNGIPLILFLGENEVKEGIVKVKSLSKKEEYVIKRDNFLQEIADIVRDNPILLPPDQQPAGQQQQEEEKKQQ